jgi:hypothetical protein
MGRLPLVLANSFFHFCCKIFIFVQPEMCYFCFDVLYCHLFNLQSPLVKQALSILKIKTLNLLKSNNAE